MPRSITWRRACGAATRLYSLRMINWHFWLATLGIVFYASSMWVAGIMQGLMWREYGADGYLVYSFAEVVAAMHPYYLIRAAGGLLYLSGFLIMIWNVAQTIARQAARRDADDRRCLRSGERPAADQISCAAPLRRQPRADLRPSQPSRTTHMARKLFESQRDRAQRHPAGGPVAARGDDRRHRRDRAAVLDRYSTIEKVEGVRPYTPLELAGRNIYVREGCYSCHSQMIRPFRDEIERYGHYSLAAESMYDHPFQWGSKRTGPDLARVGGRYSDEWHVQHLKDPRSVVPESIMPGYAFLADRDLATGDMKAHLSALSAVGVPYSKESIDKAANEDLLAQADPNADPPDLQKRYPKAQARDFDGDPKRTDRNGCAGRLSTDARHPGRFQERPSRRSRPR